MPPWRCLVDGREPGGSLVELVMLLGLLLIGILPRLNTYLAHFPLWIDEAMVALNIGARSYVGLAQPLSYDQAAPLLFLWLERLASRVGGMNEYALRAIPLLSGVALIPVTWCAARRAFGVREALVATLVIAMSLTLASYSAELKQYGVDAFVTMSVIGLAGSLRRSPGKARRWHVLTVGGILALGLSQPSVYVLVGVSAALALDRRVRATPHWHRHFVPQALLWGVTFVVLYAAFYRTAAGNPYLRRVWEGAFLAPDAPRLGERIGRAAAAILVRPLGPPSWLGRPPLQVASACVVFGGGAVACWRRDRSACVLLIAPIAALVAASTAGFYPIAPRLALCIFPLVARLYGLAVVAAVDLLLPGAARLGFTIIVVSFVVWRLGPLRDYIRDVGAVEPTRVEEVRELISSIRPRRQGEPIYVMARAVPAWVFYTTNWNAPDYGRLTWFARAASSTGLAFENRPSRGHPIDREGDSLIYPTPEGLEVIGIGAGMQYLQYTSAVEPRPDDGWARNEVRRIRDVATPRAWVVLAHYAIVQRDELLQAIRDAGGMVTGATVAQNALAWHVEFGSTS